MLKAEIKKITEMNNLTADECSRAVDEIMSGAVSSVQIAAFLTALRTKGETAEEILGAARAMRRKVSRIRHPYDTVFDNCGTGGDGASTFNISTTAAFVIAGCGVKVAKHGNRSVSSKCGSADVLTALGVNINVTPKLMSVCLEQVGLGFLFAPALHPAMKAVAPVRSELGVRTIFNLLGPLTNPAFATHQIIGVFAEEYVEKVAYAAGKLGIERAAVVYNREGIDELIPFGDNIVCLVSSDKIATSKFEASDCGLSSCELKELAGGTAEENAMITRKVLEGEPGARRDTTLLNAGYGLYVAECAYSVREGISIAADALDSGKALNILDHLIKMTGGNQYAA
ncbi:MAG: anthranilate phosphoribosyltransferase [candidate division Zixibacteria bacterium]|nr:anthranilate phosphoribosyltransferase [candidate division Zixibacteria bacterium]